MNQYCVSLYIICFALYMRLLLLVCPSWESDPSSVFYNYCDPINSSATNSAFTKILMFCLV